MWYGIKRFFWKYIVDPIVSVACFCYGFIQCIKWIICDEEFRKQLMKVADPIVETKINEHFGITEEI